MMMRASRAIILLFISSLFVGFVFTSPANQSGQGGLRLIKTSEKEPSKWMSQEEIWTLINNRANFVDVTNHKFPPVTELNEKAIPTTLRYQSIVPGVISYLNSSRISDFVLAFSTTFPNRYYTSANGIASQQWLHGQVVAAIANYTVGNASVYEFIHSWPEQRSIIARIRGADPDPSISNQVVIIGAHQDSINSANATLPAPGADDNASGSAVVLESLRALIEAKFVPRRTLEFHFFAAEEVGLLGSGEIAKTYFDTGVDVVSMLNFDVPGYFIEGNRTIRIATDHGSLALAEFITLLIEEYVDLNSRFADCGYGCSDHASFNSYGFPSTFPREPVSNPYMHTVNDVFARVNGDQIKEYAKLGVSYSIEIGEPALPSV